MATTLDTTRAGTNGSGAGALPLQPPPGRRARLPELAVGVALMVGFALAAVLWHLSATTKEPALALARAVPRGEVIEASDLRVVYLASDDRIARLGRADVAAVVGRVAVADLAPGTLLTEANVAGPVGVSEGEGVVGLALDPGQVPASDLVPGDLVNVVAGAGEGEGAVEPDGRRTSILASRAQVYAVEDLGTQGRRFVSLKLDEANANRVAAAAQLGALRLVLVGR